MTNELVLCTGCSRHVRAYEALCPFCNAALASREQGGTSWGRVGVGVLLALAAGATLNACYGAPCAGSARCDYEPDAQADVPADGSQQPDR